MANPNTNSDIEKGLTIALNRNSKASSASTAIDDSESDGKHAGIASLPPALGSPHYQQLRWKFLSMYRRMFTIVFTVNVAILIALAARNTLSFDSAATAASANLTTSILMRQEHVINILFLVASSMPPWMPLVFRRSVAKVYEYGGLHSGCGVAAACWFITFVSFATEDLTQSRTLLPVVIIAYFILALLIVLLAFAHPNFRRRYHDYFEMTHRFVGWIIVAMYWALVLYSTDLRVQAISEDDFGRALIATPSFWFLIVITMCLFYPWIRLRKRPVQVERLSNHAARLHFDYAQLDRCLGIRLSTNPLIETHAFATIPEASKGKGFSVVISNAGDWTRSMIRNPSPVTEIWVKGAPVYGVIQVARKSFKRTVTVTTGSGIGPCLSLLNDNTDGKHRVLWSTPDPLKTYGDRIISAVTDADPNAVIINTRESGRPDMVALTYQLYQQSRAEAVVVISNPNVTKKIVYEMEIRGVPAYGPVFDS